MRQPANLLLLLFLAMALAADLLPFLLTRADFLTQATTALDRLLLQLTPIAALLIMRLAALSIPATHTPLETKW